MCSQDLHRPLLPQTKQIAAARAEDGFHCGTVALHQCIRHKGLYRPGKAAALHPPCAPAPCEDALAEGQRRRQALTLGRGGAVDVLTEFKGGVAARLHQPDKGGEVPRRERFSLGKGAGVLLKIVDGPQHGAVAAARPQPGQLLPEAGLADLAQHLSAQTGRHCLHLLPDGRELAGQLAVTGPGVSNAEGHPLRQNTVGVDLIDLWRSRVGKIGKEDTAGEDTKAAFQREMIFPIGEPNTAYAQYFIGNSYLAPVSREQVSVSNVTFEPRCRNNWHIHRATKGGGQMLIGVAGRGWYQEEGKPAVEILPGTVIHIPANVKHWHGAASDGWFAHLAFEVPGEDTSNEWLEPVTDEEYDKLK